MSNNPKTKAYQRRVERLGKAIAFHLSFRSPEDVIGEIDASAPDRLIEAAIRWAIQDRERIKEMYRETVRREAETIAQLEQLLNRRAKPTLRLVGGTEAA